jgi:hypothetical protein
LTNCTKEYLALSNYICMLKLYPPTLSFSPVWQRQPWTLNPGLSVFKGGTDV